MIKKCLSILLFVLSAFLMAVFGFLLCKDYFVFYPYGSAPFYIYVIERAAECLLPAVLCLMGGIMLYKRNKKQ